MLKNIKKVGIFVVFPMIIALATYAQAFQELANFFEGMTHLIDKEYLLNKIFLFQINPYFYTFLVNSLF